MPLSVPALALEGNPALSLFGLLQRQSFLFASVVIRDFPLVPCLSIEQPRTQSSMQSLPEPHKDFNVVNRVYWT